MESVSEMGLVVTRSAGRLESVDSRNGGDFQKRGVTLIQHSEAGFVSARPRRPTRGPDPPLPGTRNGGRGSALGIWAGHPEVVEDVYSRRLAIYSHRRQATHNAGMWRQVDSVVHRLLPAG